MKRDKHYVCLFSIGFNSLQVTLIVSNIMPKHNMLFK